MKNKILSQSGATLTELLIAVTVFVMLGAAIYSMLGYILKTELAAKGRVLASNIAASELEIVRNLSYDSVGTVAGSPAGNLPQTKTVTVNNVQFNVSFDVRYVDDPFDGTATLGTDANPTDYKLVQAVVTCASCPQLSPVKMTTTVSPPGIEGGGTFGFLFLTVTNAAGQPVPQAAVHIESVNLIPQRIIDTTTDNNGELKILDLVPAIREYHVVATKTGYITDSTITPSVANPNPLKPDATISLGQVTPVTLQIDLASTLNIGTATNNCVPVGNISFTIQGNDLIGTNPDVYRYSQNFTTNGGGLAALNDLKWDTYNISVTPNQGYDVAGFIPLSPIRIDPGSVNDLKIILIPHPLNPPDNSLLVTVKDASTLLPLTGIELKLYDGMGWEYFPHPVTGQGYFMQTDWSGPSGQKDFSANNTGYFSTDGNLNLTNPADQMKLDKAGANYTSPGELVSSTFDTGMSSNFIKITWDPLVQPPQTGADSVKFQIATSNTNEIGTVWDFKGPDGTSGTYYTSASQSISAIHNGYRYIRYKVILSTENSTKTPTVESIAVSFNSGCTPPGQAIFTDLSNGNRNIDATDANVPPTYSSYSGTVDVTGATNFEILLSP